MNHTIDTHRRYFVAALVPVVCVLVAGTGLQFAAAADVPKDWRVFETDQRTQDYRNKLREGTFDATSRGFLTDVALPQLALPANRDSIDRVRRRIRESLVAEPSLPTIVEFMTALAGDNAAPLAVRVNAMLLLGELTGRDKKPWPAAAQPLVTAVGDASMPMALRVAAAAGLDRHVATAAKDLAATSGPVLVSVAKADPSAADPVAVNWLAGRALLMLAAMGSDAPAEATGVAAAILADDARPIDVRVRAAAALGGTAAEGRGVDATASLQGIRDLALTIVKDERERVRRAGSQAPGYPASPGYGDPSMLPPPMMAPPGFPDPSLGGGPGFGGPGMPVGSFPGSPPMGPSGMPAPAMSPAIEGLELSFRRAAWRLWMLGNSIEKDGATSGLILVAGPLQENARQLAKALRDAATAVDAAPSPATIERAFKMLGGKDAKSVAPAAGQAAGGQAVPAVAEGAAPQQAAAGPTAAAAPAAPPAPAQPAAPNPFAQ